MMTLSLIASATDSAGWKYRKYLIGGLAVTMLLFLAALLIASWSERDR
jgi:hypothetical protein